MEAVFALIALAALGIGVFGGYLIRKTIAKSNIHTAESKAEQMVQEAKTKQQEVLLKAKEKAHTILK